MNIRQRKALYFLLKGLLVMQKVFYLIYLISWKIYDTFSTVIWKILRRKIVHLLGYIIGSFIIILLDILMR